MTELLEFLIQYGYVLIFFWVLLDQAGLPLPTGPILLGAGALAGQQQLEFTTIIVVGLLASIPVDYGWYQLGRLRGGKVLNLLCTLSLEPDFCVKNTEQTFERMGNFALIFAKFLPGIQTLAPPMSGMSGMPVERFLILNTLGALLWLVTLTGVGYVFHTQLESLATQFSELGVWAGIILGCAFGAYLLFKFLQRRAFLSTLKMRMLNVKDVNDRLNSSDSAYVIDLRHRHDFNALPYSVPNSVRIPMEQVEQHFNKIPKDQDIILYCS
jgi:membrane protein DedA with SNARE-associated domain